MIINSTSVKLQCQRVVLISQYTAEQCQHCELINDITEAIEHCGPSSYSDNLQKSLNDGCNFSFYGKLGLKEQSILHSKHRIKLF